MDGWMDSVTAVIIQHVNPTHYKYKHIYNMVFQFICFGFNTRQTHLHWLLGPVAMSIFGKAVSQMSVFPERSQILC